MQLYLYYCLNVRVRRKTQLSLGASTSASSSGKAEFLIILLLPLLLPATRCLCRHWPSTTSKVMESRGFCSLTAAWNKALCCFDGHIPAACAHRSAVVSHYPDSRRTVSESFQELPLQFWTRLEPSLYTSQNSKGPICPSFPVPPPTLTGIVRLNVMRQHHPEHGRNLDSPLPGPRKLSAQKEHFSH